MQRQEWYICCHFNMNNYKHILQLFSHRFELALSRSRSLPIWMRHHSRRSVCMCIERSFLSPTPTRCTSCIQSRKRKTLWPGKVHRAHTLTQRHCKHHINYQIVIKWHGIKLHTHTHSKKNLFKMMSAMSQVESSWVEPLPCHAEPSRIGPNRVEPSLHCRGFSNPMSYYYLVNVIVLQHLFIVIISIFCDMTTFPLYFHMMLVLLRCSAINYLIPFDQMTNNFDFSLNWKHSDK